MKNFLSKFLLLIAILSTSFLCGCSDDNTKILLSSKPITRENYAEQFVFKKGERINAAILYKKPPEGSNFIYVQIFKLSHLSRMWGYKLEYGKKMALDPNKHYLMTHFYLNSTGNFRMKVYSEADQLNCFAKTEFWVEE